MPSVEINYWAVLVAAAINMAVGAFWYSKGVFGHRWAKLTGRKLEEMTTSTGMLISIVSALVMTFILAHFVRYAGSTSFSDGLVTGFWLWLGFVATVLVGMVAYEGRSWRLWQINAGYWLLVLLINGGLLASWR